MNIINKLLGMKIVDVKILPGVMVMEFSNATLSAFESITWTNSEEVETGIDKNNLATVSAVAMRNHSLIIDLKEGGIVTVNISSERFVEAALLEIAGTTVVFPG